MKQISVELTGEAPLMLCNINGANPLHFITKLKKEYTSKRKKTDEDLSIISKLEWLNSLYPETDGEILIEGDELILEGFGYPTIRSNMIEACLIEGAKKFKLGQAFKPAVFCMEHPRIRFEGEAPIPELFGNKKFINTQAVKLKASTAIVVTRAFFPEWKLNFKIHYLPDLANVSDIRKALDAAGQQCGIGTYRPMHGRFRVTDFQKI